MELFKKQGENDRAFIFRIGRAKEQGIIDLSWDVIADIFNKELTEIKTPEEKLSVSTYRQQYRIAVLYYEDVFKEMDVDANNVALLEEIKKEKYKFFDYRNAYHELLRGRARQEEINEIIKEEIHKGELKSLKPNYKNVNDYCFEDDVLLINLHDLHYGAYFQNYWNSYSPEECKQRMEEYLEEIKQIQSLHRCSTCVVACNGDLISGNIHQSIKVTNKENVIKQLIGVSELIACFLSELSNMFSLVRFASVAGNHSRIEKKEDAQKGERLDDIVAWWLAARLQNFDNIKFDTYDKIDDTIYLIEIKGKIYCGIHGDYDYNDKKILDLKTMLNKDIYGVLTGHLHHNKIDSIQGIKLIMSGSLQGVDDFCISKRLFGKPEQLVCICNEKGVKCAYDIVFD
jgi:predicted phosphodiesterase